MSKAFTAGLVFLILVIALPSFAQEHSGTITDAETGDALIGANVQIAGSNIGSSTDADGNFSFTYSSNEEYTIQVSFIGYRTSEREISPGDNTSNLNFELGLDPFKTDEIVVTGISSRTSKAVAEVAVARVNMGTIADRADYSSLSAMVVGKVPGIDVQSSDGSIGAPFRFQVRGGGGLHGDAQPIIIIDGVRTQQDIFQPRAGDYNSLLNVSTINNLNAEEIESIEVLKGPAGAASYGTDGSNGVILITTKKGRLGSAGAKNYTINYKGTLGWNEKEREYTERDVRSFKEVNETFRKGPIQRNNFNISGGTDRIRYFTSFDKGLVKGHLRRASEDRTNYRVNLDMYPTEKIDISVAAGYFRGEIEHNNAREFSRARSRRNPFDGTSIRNTREYYEQFAEHVNTNQFTGSLNVNFRPFLGSDIRQLRGLSGRFTVGMNDRDDESTFFQTPSEEFELTGQRHLNRGNIQNITYTGDARYDYNLWGITSSATAGAQLYDNRRNSFTGRTNDFVTGLISTLSAGDEIDRGSFRETDFQERKAGVFTEHSFSYNNTYFWSAMFRRDYVSALKVGHKAIYYPRLSASIRLDRFDAVPDAFGMLKLRSGYGETGILPGRTDAISALYGSSASPYGVGARLARIGNPGIQPERLKEFEIGIEAEYRGFLAIDFSYYRTSSQNSIFGISPAPSLGTGGGGEGGRRFNDNIAEIEGHGIESQTQFFFSGRQFGGWSFNLNNIVQWSGNEVKSLGGSERSRWHGTWVIEEGYERGWARPDKGVAAVYTTADDPARGDHPAGAGYYKDLRVGGPIDAGHMFPPWTGSISGNLSVGPFSAYAMFEWKYNYLQLNDTLIDHTGPRADGQGSVILHFDQIREELQIEEFGLIPEDEELQPNTPEYIASAEWWAQWGDQVDENSLRRADFFKFRELNISYDAEGLIPRLGLDGYIDGLTFGFSATNLWTLYHNNFRGLISPETVRNIFRNVPDNVASGKSVPPPQTLTFFTRIQL